MYSIKGVVEGGSICISKFTFANLGGDCTLVIDQDDSKCSSDVSAYLYQWP